MDMTWLATQAKQLHDFFSSIFYLTVTVLLLFGVVLNFFKMSMGHVPEFMQLLARAVLAALILAALPEIMNILADTTDQMASQIGQLNNIHLVLAKMSEKLHTLTWSWVNVKDSLLLLISFVSFFFVYGSVYIIDAMFSFTWTVLYVFSPLLIAAFTLPSTAQATRGLFQSLIEVCLWKICWAAMAALLWSYAYSQINAPDFDVDFLTAIFLNLLLAFSVVLTPVIVKSLVNGGMAGAATVMGGALLATATMTPQGMIGHAKSGIKKTANRLLPNFDFKPPGSAARSEKGF